VTVQAEPGDEPCVVVLILVIEAPRHDLPGKEPAGGLADADQRIVSPAEDWVYGGDRVDAVGDQEISLRADRPVLDLTAVDDLVDVERPFIDLRTDDERSPHG